MPSEDFSTASVGFVTNAVALALNQFGDMKSPANYFRTSLCAMLGTWAGYNTDTFPLFRLGHLITFTGWALR